MGTIKKSTDFKHGSLWGQITKITTNNQMIGNRDQEVIWDREGDTEEVTIKTCHILTYEEILDQ